MLPPMFPQITVTKKQIYIYIKKNIYKKRLTYPPPLQHVTKISLKTAHKHLDLPTHPKKKKKRNLFKYIPSPYCLVVFP